ncbi:MAG TPA: hypothetical protein VKQ36_02490, partial [Ktedonobacterales bacterium]|nr:hypothetical protein [Ktedonobacterales bacterium]
IRQVCQQAVIAQMTLLVPPASYHGGPMSAATRQFMLTRAQQSLRRYYADPQLSAEITQAQTGIRSEQSGSPRYLDAGADALSFSQISVNGATASVTAQGVIWTRVEQDQGNGHVASASPHNRMDFTFTLRLIHGGWLISGQTIEFAPGGEP